MFSDETMIVYGAMKKAQHGNNQRDALIKDLDGQVTSWRNHSKKQDVEISALKKEVSEKDIEIAKIKKELAEANAKLQQKEAALQKQTTVSKAMMCKNTGLGNVAERLMKELHKVNPENEVFIQDSVWQIPTTKTEIGDNRMRIWDDYEKGVKKTVLKLNLDLVEVGEII